MTLSMRRYTSLLAALVLLLAHGRSEETCAGKESSEGVCEASTAAQVNDDSKMAPHCGMINSLCSSHGTIYRHGGTAQAYTANAPFKSTVCEVDASKKRHKVAGWPVFRRSFRNPPKLNIQVTLHGCVSQTNDCCCQPIDPNVINVIDAWQARPDGTYSSLRNNDGACRARAMPDMQGLVTLETYAPGSTGVLGGLGPSGWDFGPYVAPVIHLLATADGYAPTLVNVPIFFDRKTLEQKSFHWKDWRGHGWMNGSPPPMDETAYRIVSWKPNVKDHVIDVQLDIYMAASDEEIILKEALCPAKLYGLPWSFYKEPIAECAPSLLDFFAV